MVAMPDREWESHPFYMSISNQALGVKPARLSQLYSDNILMWDVTGIGPTFGSQYVVGYELDFGGPGYSYGSLSDPKKAYLRYRSFADEQYYVPLTSPLRNDIPIFPGSNKEVMPGASNGQRGNVRWRHGQNNAANFLFADGTVRTMKMTTGTPGKPDCKGEVLHKYFRLKPPPRYKPFN
jgi:prepilin-type processing-associated H-X9-DG protein